MVYYINDDDTNKDTSPSSLHEFGLSDDDPQENANLLINGSLYSEKLVE